MLTAEIVEGVMDRILYEIGRCHWNAHQRGWGPHWGESFSSLEWGVVSAQVIDHKMDDQVDQSLHIGAFGVWVWTWLDGKRPFYRATCPDGWSNLDFVTWAEKVFGVL